ncbi:MAG: nucleotidyltransferase [Pseudomonadota bacterium]
MASVQTQLESFHRKIQLDNLDENTTLREKRDLLLRKLREGLAKKFAGQQVPTFEHRNQGSYRIGTGIRPTNGRDYDIDVALLFNIDPEEIGPVEIKRWVHEILDTHPHTAVIKRPCVTVQYTKAGEDAYHVDFAIYTAATMGRAIPLLAKGFVGSEPENKVWQPSDFQGLIDALEGRFSDADDRLQFRRIVRYMKRWKDTRFSASGEAAPKGVGLTCAAYRWFRPTYTRDPLSLKRRDDDLTAMKDLVSVMLANFVGSGENVRLCTPLPTEPWDDPFERMSDKQMLAFKKKLEDLHAALVAAAGRVDPVEACRDLKPFLGDDFEIPDRNATAAATVGPALVSTGHYA